MAEFTRPLVLVSPHTKGQDVRDAQYLLTHNRQGQNYHPGPLDGEYGEQAAGATRRAKFWCGYPASAIDGHFGQQLYSYLLGMQHKGWKPLPLAFRARRNLRLRQQKPRGKELALQMALTDAARNIHEDPYGSNNQKYGVWYGLNYQPWCAIGVTYWMVHANVPGFARGSRWSYVPAIVNDARWGHNHIALTGDPVAGDLVSYTTNAGPNEHVEIFDKWVQKGHSFWAVGGNTDNHADNVNANGGAVVHQIRYTGMVTHFVRVGI